MYVVCLFVCFFFFFPFFSPFSLSFFLSFILSLIQMSQVNKSSVAIFFLTNMLKSGWSSSVSTGLQYAQPIDSPQES